MTTAKNKLVEGLLARNFWAGWGPAIVSSAAYCLLPGLGFRVLCDALKLKP